jgi:Na+-translocating ferredoxin:NAD+ oxidoreductase subunit B
MAKKGLIFRVKRNGRSLYQAHQFFVGIIEFQINRVDTELMELMAEYSPYLNSTGLELKTKHMRIIPIESTIDKIQSIQSYHQFKSMVQDEDVIAVAPCLCR